MLSPEKILLIITKIVNGDYTASQLQKGMRVTFQGKCDGLMMNVLMKNCVLVDNLSDLKKKKK